MAQDDTTPLAEMMRYFGMVAELPGAPPPGYELPDTFIRLKPLTPWDAMLARCEVLRDSPAPDLGDANFLGRAARGSAEIVFGSSHQRGGKLMAYAAMLVMEHLRRLAGA